MNLDKFKKDALPYFAPQDADELCQWLDASEPNDDMSVAIFHSDETGEELWVVAFRQWTDFWLGGFGTLAEAKAYCAEYSFEYSLDN